MNIAQLAELILKVQELREKSFDQEKANKNTDAFINVDEFYNLTLREAVKLAIDELEFDPRMRLPIYLINKFCWNNIQEWAELIISIRKENGCI